MQFIFFGSDDRILFARDDAESATWQEEEYSLQAMFPFIPDKRILRGQRIGFTDETGVFQAFEIRKVRNYEPDHYQEITAEHIAVAELTDEFVDAAEFTNIAPQEALASVLSGTQWQVGTVAVGDIQAQQTVRAQIAAFALNGNVDLTRRPVVYAAKMKLAGYTEFDGDYATLYSQTYTWDTEQGTTLATLLMTPIRPDGTVLSPEQMDDYMLDLYEAAGTVSGLKAADHDGLIIHILEGEQISAMDDVAEQAHTLSERWQSCIEAEASSGDIQRGKVWPAVCTIRDSWNVYITPRVVMGASGITGRYLDIETYGGVYRGLFLSIDKNADEIGVTVDDTNVVTAMFGYGRNVEAGNGEETAPLTLSQAVWTETADHPAKPLGQDYLVNPAALEAYGRGPAGQKRNRWGFYQNSNIDDPQILLQKTWEALKQDSQPNVTVNCVVQDLYRLGYRDVPMRLHDMAIVELRPTGDRLMLEIVGLTKDLLNPQETRPTIGKYIPNIIYINRETNEGRSSRTGGSKGQTEEEYERGEFETAIDYNKYQIALRATQFDLKDLSYRTAQSQAQIDIQHNFIDSIVGGTGMTLDANGYAVRDADGNPVFNVGTTQNLYTRILQERDRISNIVSYVGVDLSGYTEFDPKKDYHPGDLVLYDGKPYMFLVRHTGTESNPLPWDASHAQAVDVSSQIKQNTSRIDQTDSRIASVITQSGVVTTVFDKNATYRKGDRVLYDGLPYEFTEAHTGNWTGTDAKRIDTLQTQIEQTAGSVSIVAGDVSEIDGKVTAIEGSGLWTGRDNIVAVTGKMKVVGDDVVIVNGSGLKTEIGNATFGIWNENNLTAGVLIKKINGGNPSDQTDQTTQAYILASKVQLSGGQSAVTLDDKVVIDTNGYTKINGMFMVSGTGTSAKHVTINNGNISAGGGIDISSGQSLKFIGSGSGEYYGFNIGGGTNTTDIKTIVTGFGTVTPNAETGAITIPYSTVRYPTAGSNNQNINFNIADMAFYKNHVGISSVDPGNWQYDSTEHKYYNPVVATAKDSTQANPDTMTANVFIPDISLTPVLGLTDVGTVKAWGPSVSGTVYSAAADLSLYLKEKDNYVYLTKTNSEPVPVGPNSNVVARKEIQGGTVTSGTITDILTRGDKVTYNSTSEMIRVLLQATGTDISNAPFDDYVELSVSATGVSLSKDALSNTSTDTYGHTYAGRYYIRGSGGLFKVQNVNTITASVTAHRLNLELSAPYATPFTWNATGHENKYSYTVKSGLKSSSGTDTLANVLSYETQVLELDPFDAIQHGKTLVTIDTITLGTITANSSTRTATVRTTVTLDNGETKTANVDVSAIYQAGLDGGPAISSAPFIARLVDTDNVFIKNRQKTVNVSAIYQKGVNDATPVTPKYYITTDGDPIIMWKASPSGDYSNFCGWLYPRTEVTVLGTSGYFYQVSYDGVTGYIAQARVEYSTSPTSSTNYPGKTGWSTFAENGYTYYAKTNTANVNLREGPSTSYPIILKMPADAQLYCMYDPADLPPDNQWNDVVYKAATHNLYLGSVDCSYINMEDATITVTVNWLRHSSGDYGSSIPTFMLPNGAETNITSNPVSDTSYVNTPVSSGVSINDFFNPTKTGFFGRYELAAVALTEMYHKVNFTVSYSDGSPSQTYTCEFKSYKKTSSAEFDVGQTVYVYASNGGSVIVRTVPSVPSGTYGNLTPHTPVTIVSGPDNGYYQIRYAQTGYNTVTGYINADYLRSSVQGNSNYNYTGWVKSEPVEPTVTSRTISIVEVIHNRSVTTTTPISTRFTLKSPYTTSGGGSLLVANSQARVVDVYNNHGSGYTRLSSLTAYFSQVTHSSSTYDYTLEHSVIFTVTTNYSDNTSTSTTYVGKISSNKT